jgi:hypothetical protein
MKFCEVQPNYEKLAKEYMVRRKEEGKPVTKIFQVILMYQ